MKETHIYMELLAVINHVLHGRELPDKIHWEGVASLAASHRLIGFVYRAMTGREDLDEGLVSQVETLYFSTVGEQVRQEYYTKELFDALEKAEIEYMPLKGYHMRALYPQPTWRTSSDLELLLPTERQEEVEQILVRFGFSLTEEDEAKRLWVLDHVRVTLHSRIPTGQTFEDLRPRLTEVEGHQLGMTDEDYCLQMLFVMSHLLFHGRISVRMVLDLYIYRHAKPELDRARVEAALSEMGLLQFTAIMEHLCEVWFGDEPQCDETMLVGSYIAASNAYGVDEKTPAQMVQRYMVFPPYAEMKREFPVLRPCPFLLPFLWVARCFRLIFAPKRKERKELLLAARQQAEARSAKMEERVREITGLNKES